MATPSQAEYLKALEAEAEARRKQDMINTNILNSNDPKLLMAQDVIIGYAAGQVVDAVTVDLLKDSLIRAIKGEKAVKIPFKNPQKVFKLGPKAVRNCIEATAGRIKSSGLKVVRTINSAPKVLKEALAAAKASRAAFKKAGEAVAEKTATKLSQEAAEKIAQTTAKVAIRTATAAKSSFAVGKIVTKAFAGCVAGPVGCAASIALEVAMLAFDVVNIVLDMMDEKGFQVIINKADIKAVKESTTVWMNSEYNTRDDPAYFDEEIFFDWESFLYDIDENDNIVANEVWATRYEKLRDDFMKDIGITGDWRSRIETVDVATPEDPGVLSPVTVQMQELKVEMLKDSKKKKPKKTSNTNTLLIAAILTVVFVVGIIIFMNSSGEDGSEPSTNNGGT